MSTSFWSTLMAKIVDNLPHTGTDKELRYSIIFGTRWLEEGVRHKSIAIQRGDLVKNRSDACTNTTAFGATAQRPKEAEATDKPTETRAVGWAGQLFIKRAGRTETMTATSDDTIRALKAQMRLPGERLVWGRQELCQDDRTLGSYGVPKEVRPHQSPLSHAPPPCRSEIAHTEIRVGSQATLNVCGRMRGGAKEGAVEESGKYLLKEACD